MTGILMRLTALCMLSAFGEQMTGEGRLKEGVRLISGLLAAQMILEIALALPEMLTGG